MRATSPIIKARNVKLGVRLRLVGAAAGLCEFRGCNKEVFTHPLTLAEGNYSETAHIYAFSPSGPRGANANISDINGFENLILLCLDCHHLIDTHVEDYPVTTLKLYKKEHEQRIRESTSIGPELRTRILQLKGTIGGQFVDIPAGDIRTAICPRYPAEQNNIIIDLTPVSVEDPDFFQRSQEIIRRDLKLCMNGRIEGSKMQHFSVFAFAPIPVLICLGRELGDKLNVDIYQRNLDTQEWKWQTNGKPVEYDFHCIRSGTDFNAVGLILSLSGKVAPSSLPCEIDGRYFLYEMTLKKQEPSRTYLRRKEDLLRFRREYRKALAIISRAHNGVRQVHLFPAVPISVAIACGQELLPKAHPEIIIYDNKQGNFRKAISINNGG